MFCIRNELWNVGIGKSTDNLTTLIYIYIHFHRYTQTIHLIYTSDVRFGPLTKPAPAEWSLWGWLMLSPIFYTLRIINIFSQNRLTPPKRGMFIILCRHSSQTPLTGKRVLHFASVNVADDASSSSSSRCHRRFFVTQYIYLCCPLHIVCIGVCGAECGKVFGVATTSDGKEHESAAQASVLYIARKL